MICVKKLTLCNSAPERFHRQIFGSSSRNSHLARHIIPGLKVHATLLGYSLGFPPPVMMMAMSKGLSARSAPPPCPPYPPIQQASPLVPPPVFPPGLHHYFLFTWRQEESLAPPFPLAGTLALPCALTQAVEMTSIRPRKITVFRRLLVRGGI